MTSSIDDLLAGVSEIRAEAVRRRAEAGRRRDAAVETISEAQAEVDRMDRAIRFLDEAVGIIRGEAPIAARPAAKADLAPSDGYVCEGCGRSFPTRQGLGGHRAKVHPRRAPTVTPVDEPEAVPVEEPAAAVPGDGRLGCPAQGCPHREDRPEELERHLLRLHPLFRGDDPDDVEYRRESIRTAEALAGRPPRYGLDAA